MNMNTKNNDHNGLFVARTAELFTTGIALMSLLGGVASLHSSFMANETAHMKRRRDREKNQKLATSQSNHVSRERAHVEYAARQNQALSSQRPSSAYRHDMESRFSINRQKNMRSVGNPYGQYSNDSTLMWV